MANVSIGMKVELIKDVDNDHSVGSTATILFIDDFDRVHLEWDNNSISSLDDSVVMSSFKQVYC